MTISISEIDAAQEIKLQRAAARSKQIRKKRSEFARRCRTSEMGNDTQNAYGRSAAAPCNSPAALSACGGPALDRGGERVHRVAKAVLRARLAKGRLRGGVPVLSSHRACQTRKGKRWAASKGVFRGDAFHDLGAEDFLGSLADGEFAFELAASVPDSPACEDSAASTRPLEGEASTHHDAHDSGTVWCPEQGLPEVTSASEASVVHSGTFVDAVGLPLAARYEALANVMDASVDEPGVQKQCSDALCKMCQESSGHAAQLVALGAVGPLSRAMDRHPEESALQVSALLAFQYLNSLQGGKSGVTADSCGISTLVRTMGRQLHCAPVLEAASRALVAIVTSCMECKAAASESRAPEAMLSAMAAQVTCAGVQEAGCQLLKELAARSEHVQDRILAGSGIERVLTGMDVHAAVGSLQVAGCGVLRNMSARSLERRSQIAALGGVRSVLRAISTHDEDWQVQWAGCWALCCLTLQNAPSQAEAVANGGMQLVLRSLDLHLGEPKVQEAGCWALSSLGGVSSVPSTTLSECLQAVSRATQAHPVDEVLKAGRAARQKLIMAGMASRKSSMAGPNKGCRTSASTQLVRPSIVKRHALPRGLTSIQE
eukprot:TRINITY_DN17991_c0_g1_i1.p1 TRINITY_DN17991_c0_g1~~TRINITY_DN17991_c0_g1_i1.p1  ORF type:complete len:602 (+),score=86.56 TRINITY_DN17991_c0_g1_i1:74-1879(+)